METHQSFMQLTPELWITQSRWLRFNSGIFVSRGQACLIDPGMDPSELAGLARFVAGQGASPVLIVLTHWHWDHVLGPEHFPGVPVLAHPRYLDEVEHNREGILREIAKWEERAGLRRETPFDIPTPTTLADDGRAVAVGGLTLRLLHVPGHSSDQLAVYHAERGALWASDILSDIEIPIVSDRLEAYQKTLSRLEPLDIRVLAPGHGSATTDPLEARRRLEHDRAYLATLRLNMGRAVGRNWSLEQAQAACEAMEYRRREGSEAIHRLNIESVYVELGGKADPAKVGWQME